MKLLIKCVVIVMLLAFPSTGFAANSLTSNPIIIDTTTGASITRTLKIQSITWVHNSAHSIAADCESGPYEMRLGRDPGGLGMNMGMSMSTRAF